ncbi:hypothetical protein K437DRAFT_258924 [Tilletiaria anomala UBC 951]|uniref:Uncharacterized protein n=1 Tax=Tilletiaria anomala (strain ATCC 24038 / CBS 436.72 / UBC 951) TaxID=1037660 RepID=A0A066VMD8_TILAU|nr:uncharacterized protein K437DRAFT_258924 [Tilletiaria anomala UBC 951]KDN39750.1 hypothetical protein K437DRAFT_258924 [Tilletiaria anomala UBC 951]
MREGARDGTELLQPFQLEAGNGVIHCFSTYCLEQKVANDCSLHPSHAPKPRVGEGKVVSLYDSIVLMDGTCSVHEGKELRESLHRYERVRREVAIQVLEELDPPDSKL